MQRWYKRQHAKEKKDSTRSLSDECFFCSAEGGASFVHRITKPAVRRGLQVPEELEKDAKPVRKCQEKRKEWTKHCQCDSEVQSMEDKPWKNEELRSSEEGLPKLKQENPKTQQGYHGCGL